MYVIYSPHQEKHCPPYELHFGRRVPPSEVPERTQQIVQELRAVDMGPIVEPRSYPLECITAVHDKDYLEYLRTALQTPLTDPESDGQPATVLFPSMWPYSDRWPVRARTVMAQVGYYCFDTYTPIVAGTCEAALLSAECALTGADLLREGEPAAFALCRPPGHHAMHRMCGGYCYLNNAAIAAEYLSLAGPVAILDVDYHHGNGTQSIFYDTDRVLYVSIHADPEKAYPYYSGYADERGEGKGLGFNLNLPLPSGTADEQYSQTLEQALTAVRDFAPAYLIVSLGFDTCRDDPICDFQLSPEFFGHMAKRIAALDVSSLIVAEGGYNVERLGYLVVDFLRGWQIPSARG
jgi:acetoin utilization deacetylase AcuC-like enzyme